MYNVNISDSGKFKVFLGLIDTEYVDVYLNGEIALFICNTVEYFSMICFPCAASVNETVSSVRIKRATLRSLFCDGSMQFVIKDGIVSLSFIDTVGSNVCTVDFKQQPVFGNVYSHKMELLEKANLYSKFSLDDLTELYKIAKSEYSFINLDSGVAAVYLKCGARVYKPISFKETLCLTAKSFELLRKCGKNFFSIENYVGVTQGPLTILVTKARCQSNSEFYSLIGENSMYKANLIATLGFSNLLRFISLKHPKEQSVTIDLQAGICIFAEDNETFKVPIAITEKQLAPGAALGSISIPMSVLTSAVANAGITKFRMKRKKSFIELSFEDLYILFS